MNKEKQLQYFGKVMGALGELFNPQSEFFVDINDLDKGQNLNDFLHVVATRCPQMIFVKLTNKEVDPLEFNHIMNRLIMQDMSEKKK